MANKRKKGRKLSDESKQEIEIVCYLLFRLAIIAAIVFLIKGIIKSYRPVELEFCEYEPVFIEEIITEEQMAKRN